MSILPANDRCKQKLSEHTDVVAGCGGDIVRLSSIPAWLVAAWKCSELSAILAKPEVVSGTMGLPGPPAEIGIDRRYISWLQYYMVYFFVRASVQLFVLRLLPSYKKWQQKSVYLAFAINFLVTLYACITFGVSCRPFRALWEDVPNSKCFPTNLLVITNRVNAGKALDNILKYTLFVRPLIWFSACLPVWRRYSRNTDIPALERQDEGHNQETAECALRAKPSDWSAEHWSSCVGNKEGTHGGHHLYIPTTYKFSGAKTDIRAGNSIRSYYVCMFEVKLGIIVACGPALRQFWAYRKRTKSWLPTKKRQYPNEDFEKMRYRINLRDVFWYRKAPMVGDRVYEAARIFRNKSPPPDASSGNPQSSAKVKNSVLDIWKKRIQNVMNSYHNDEDEVCSAHLWEWNSRSILTQQYNSQWVTPRVRRKPLSKTLRSTLISLRGNGRTVVDGIYFKTKQWQAQKARRKYLFNVSTVSQRRALL